MDEHHHPSPDDDDEEQLVRRLTSHNRHHHDFAVPMPVPSASPSLSQAEDAPPSESGMDASLAPHRVPASDACPDHLRVHRSPSVNTQKDLQTGSNGIQGRGPPPPQASPDAESATLFTPTPSEASAAPVSPGFGGTPQRQEKPLLPAFTPPDRSLPSREVTDESLDDAYVAFILYCNPVVTLSTDTAELRRGFRSPPKSDGKTFSTYTLLELIRQFENKEIKTWNQLAIQLGVEPPVLEKNQSAQKVQQYAVRLKRWMHAMHVDAFFEYCLGKPHSYYTQVPPLHAPYPEHGRDNVPVEEDLALRALHPESRPKRGRRRTEEKDVDLDTSISPAKRPNLDTSVVTASLHDLNPPGSALISTTSGPSTGRTDDMDRYVESDPWVAASTITSSAIGASTPQFSAHPASASIGGQQFRWRLNPRDSGTPLTPYPPSAVTPATPHPPDSGFYEPPSAVTPISAGGKGRARRRHGPAVSSAWPSSGNPVTGKLRGRPPSNRSVRDGPFSTFPANPKTREGPLIDLQGSTPVSTPVSAKEGSVPLPPRPPGQAPQMPGKPSGLQLRVPQHRGGPVVRLATPTVMVNGIMSQTTSSSSSSSAAFPSSNLAFGDGLGASNTQDAARSVRRPGQPLGFGKEDLLRALTAKLTTSSLVGGSSPSLGLAPAKRLATIVIEHMRTDPDEASDEEGFLISCATCFGLAGELDHDLGIRSEIEAFSVHVTAIEPPSNSGSGDLHHLAKDQPREPDGPPRIDPPAPPNGSSEDPPSRPEEYTLKWTLRSGPLTGVFTLRVIVLPEPRPLVATDDGGPDGRTGEVGWKKKYLTLRKEHDGEIARIRRSVLEAVL
ncbi:MAG: hypothetical protein M1838_002639 [Thelocarpon superellum]|nr:MAG: hypothetical protein M1838_002639 [Thelocarpon superellum]